MSKIFKGKKQSNFEYSKAKESTYCKDTGLIASASCPNKEKGYFKSSDLGKRCNMHS